MKRLIAGFLAVLCVFSTLTVSASAAKYNAPYKMICNGSGYTNFNNTQMNGQTMTEKYVKVGKNKVLQVNPYTAVNTNNKHGLKQYVRFTIWIYDINTGKRIVNTVCTNNGSVTWKNTTGKTVYLSVQARPYIAQAAWKSYNYSNINSYIKATQYRFTCNNNYKK